MDNTNVLCDIKNTLKKIDSKLGVIIIGVAVYIWYKNGKNKK